MEEATRTAEKRAEEINVFRYKNQLSMHRYDYVVDKVDEIGGTR